MTLWRWRETNTMNNLKHYRKLAGMTLDDVANFAASSKSNIWEVENNKTIPGVQMAYRIAAAVNQPIEEVFPDQNEYIEETVTTVRVKR